MNETSIAGIPELKMAFDRRSVRLALSSILPLKAVPPSVKATIKYQQILASIQEVGLVESPVVTRSAKQADQYFLVDGHLRLVAVRELGWTDVECLVTDHDDTYTYNKRVGRLSAVQDHKMIVRAMERGVSAERLGRSLGISVETVRHRFRLLNGICEEAAGLLGDAPCPAKVFSILRQMKSVRQIEAAELMLGNKNYTVQFPGTVESIGRIERELAALQMQTSAVEDSYGPDVLHLTIVKGHLGKWLGNASVVRWLARHRPEYLKEFQRISEAADVGAG
jgi:hypothetical protein